MAEAFQFSWCRSEQEAQALAAFFHANLSPNYISHSELQGPRAINPSQWSPDIKRIIVDDMVSRVANPLDAPPDGTTKLLAQVADKGTASGVFLVTFSRAAPVHYAILEDMMIAPSLRGKGVGSAFIAWVSAQCRQRGLARLFLESGINNHRAHDLFDREGFKKVSIVMMKEL